MPAKPLILASQSPRRAELLKQVGLAFVVQPADIDETPRAGEAPEDYVLRMAREKAGAIAASAPEDAVLAADTSVVVDGDILGKPGDRREAAAMLRRLSDRRHQVISAVALQYRGAIHTTLVVSEVGFAALDEAVIADYLRSGEADDKAGAYGIQGRAAAFICHLAGSYSGVVGLPLYETVTLLREAGWLAGE